jgi:ribonuclease HI
MKEWNLYTDGSVTCGKGYEGASDKIPCAWAAILQNADMPAEESVVFGAELGSSHTGRIELKAVLAGLRQTESDSSVRIFCDNLTVLGALLHSMEEDVRLQFIKALSPSTIRQSVETEFLQGKTSIRPFHGMNGLLNMSKQEGVILDELKDLVERRTVSLTRVADMKTQRGKNTFPVHERCHAIAKAADQWLSYSL